MEQQPRPASGGEPSSATKERRAAALLPLSLVLLFVAALIAGLRTTVDFDLGWQMAMGRYLVEHHSVPRVDLFSYTISGHPWSYPPLAGVIFYGLYRVAGYAAISWCCALASALLALLAGARRSVLAVLLALLAVPVFASETMPRASLFTLLLLALLGRLLLAHARGRATPLWPLPIILLAWANLHLGFAAGLALLLGYVLYELEQQLYEDRRDEARARLRRAVPWIALAMVSVLANPLGVHLFRLVAQQARAVPWQTVLLAEWQPPVLHGIGRQLLDVRQPDCAIWWLLLGSVPLSLVLVVHRHRVAAILLIVAWAAFLLHRRMEGPAAIVASLLGGEVLAWAEARLATRRQDLLRRGLVPLLFTLVFALTAVRTSDILTHRASLAAGEITRFGAGPSWWLPASGVDALERLDHRGNIFAPFDLGSYLIWRGKKVFADGRSVPFGPELIEEQRRLAATSLDDPTWAAAADRYHIDAAIFPLSRLLALGESPLAADCASRSWAPVYMDATAIVLLRRTAANARVLEQNTIDCRRVDLLDSLSSSHGIDRYQMAANAAAIYAALGRLDAAGDALRVAGSLSRLDDPSLIFVRAQVASAMGLPLEAERWLRRALAAEPSDAAWYNLALVLASQQRFQEGAAALEQAAALSPEPWQRRLLAGQMLVAGRQPQAALAMLDRASEANPFSGRADSDAREFRAAVATARAQANLLLQRLPEAIAQQKIAVTETPDDAARQELLKKLCTLSPDHCRDR